MENIYFPEEILAKILLNLPAKSLARFSCVSKSWRDLIRGDPSFGLKHLNHYFSKNNHHHENGAVFLVRHLGSFSFSSNGSSSSNRYHQLLLTDDCNGGKNISLRVFPSPALDFPYHLYGSCNGILCIAKSSSIFSPVYLYNPTIKEYLKLLDSNCLENSPFKGFWNKSVLGFGFDVLSDDYKVIRIGRMGDHTLEFVYVEIYKLSTDCWTKLELELEGVELFGYSYTLDPEYWNSKLINSLVPAGGVFVNDCCYWSGEFLVRSVVLEFNFRSEIFRLISHPHSRPNPSFITVTPSVLGDSLALIVECMHGLFEVWVMGVQQEEEDGEEDSLWSKKCSLRVGPELYHPSILTCWNHNWLLLRSFCGRHIRCCFLGDGFTANKDWEFDVACDDALSAVVFQPTLVSLQEKKKLGGLTRSSLFNLETEKRKPKKRGRKPKLLCTW
ncbi:OLC1v1038011C1 [Oldenlandia corymbosa var. corymbosa]|uniref:OLC1v1038011C1 n=1 Tax=Oldenlandia corymbosa var. corymbosa TaxID=529605 RepID=A0AAV1D116_OLDCO|nr:OLC1v1038011C1 [Oldenlandia corymbosa var. corymbosa]